MRHKSNNWLTSLLTVTFFMLIASFPTHSQDYVKGKLISVEGPCSFTVLLDDSKAFKLKLIDVEPVDSLSKVAIKYLRDLLLDEIIFIGVFARNETQRTINGCLVYNCEMHDSVAEDPFPCISASFLDLELILKGYLVYTGSNDYFLRNKY